MFDNEAGRDNLPWETEEMDAVKLASLPLSI